MRAQRDFAERIEIMVNATKLTLGKNELNDKLRYAARDGDIKRVRELIGGGADVDAKSMYMKTALHWAALNGDFGLVKILIKRGADVNAKNKNGETALHKAALYGHVDIVKILIEKGVNVNVKDKNNETAVEIAIRCGYHQIAELIDDSIKHRKALDILNIDMDELVRMADESAKRLCRKG